MTRSNRDVVARGQVAHRATQPRGRPGRTFAALLFAAGIGGGAGGCAGELGGKSSGPVILPRTCADGPHCVTGQVTDQFSNPIAGVTCSVIGQRGEGYSAKSDARGFFYLDRLPAPPPQVRCSKPGLEPSVQVLYVKPAGQAAPVYVVMRRLGDAECSCDPNALVGGREPCPPEQCH